jgi:hypothetical protein
MHKFGKVVLSRKGFDSSAGGGYSPFDPQTGSYIVLPIPVGKKEQDICNPLKYKDIKLKGDYLHSYKATDLKSLMEEMGEEATIKTKGGKEKSEYAHFDPWLSRCPWLAEGSNHHIGAFGQVGIPQAQLHNQGVGEGSLFLFFSRFKPIKPIGQNRENRIVPSIGSKHLNEGLYFIYGWLKVKEVIREHVDECLWSQHPHNTKEYFDYYANRENAKSENGKNTIYIADKLMFNDGSNFPGCGYFRELNKDLCLSASDPAQAQVPGNWKPSRWSLPGFFKEKCLSVLKNKGQICHGSWLVPTNWQWQEAVFDFGESEKFYPWFRSLLKQVVSDL